MMGKGEKTENQENEKYHFRKWTEKGGKFRNVHCRTWNMARKLKIMENEKHPLDDLKNDEITKNVKNEKCTLKDLEYGENR